MDPFTEKVAKNELKQESINKKDVPKNILAMATLAAALVIGSSIAIRTRFSNQK